MENRTPSPLDDFLFDLNGYLILKKAADSDLLARLNARFDEFPADLPMGAWLGGAQRRDYTPETGLELHQAVTLGGPFAELIDHPSWINYVRHYGGEEKSYVEGVFIDESIASVRTSGGHHPVHSGGFRGAMRGAYGYKNGVFRCGQINIILALNDIGPGDGATMIVPASHKSNFDHPQKGDYAKGDRMDALQGALPAYLEAGDALLFVDGLMHGGSSRTNAGERRITIYRYGPIWGASRFGYQYENEFLDTLSPVQRRILQPVPPVFPGKSAVPKDYTMQQS
ncbi:MAG: phytanoyl-CoA dioxygenase family protein [Armatimonadetes bacterium]|nr:phytanoyl-CoA dioxygenase family protein [Armatimonadota bacterium]